MSHRANSVSRILSCSLLLVLPRDLTSLSDGVSTRNKPSRPQVDMLFIIATESKLEQFLPQVASIQVFYPRDTKQNWDAHFPASHPDAQFITVDIYPVPPRWCGWCSGTWYSHHEILGTAAFGDLIGVHPVPWDHMVAVIEAARLVAF